MESSTTSMPTTPGGASMASSNSSAKVAPPTQAEKPAPAYIIGIAGAASSGKTITSLILSTILEEALVKDPVVNARLGQVNPSVKIFAADNYFLPHNQCPRVSFKPRLGDEAIVMGQVNTEDRVETSDRDCLAAIDWVRLHEDIKAFKDGTADSDDTTSIPESPDFKRTTTHKAEAEKYREAMASYISPAELQRLAAKVRDTIADNIMFNLGDEFPGQLFKDLGENGDLLNIRIAIVEGFLLFSRERTPAAAVTPLTPEQDRRALGQRPRPLVGSPKACHEAISDMLDVRLYINVGSALAYRRRVSREPYMDSPRGTRMPGQMWKTTGYFFDVAWRNFRSYSMIPGSLFKQLPQANLVEHALDHILYEMELVEEIARRNFVTEQEMKKREEERLQHQDDSTAMKKKEKEEMLQHQDDYAAMTNLMVGMNLPWDSHGY